MDKKLKGSKFYYLVYAYNFFLLYSKKNNKLKNK